MYLSEYVLAQADRDDAVGDLARDAAADETWPHQANSVRLSQYLAGQVNAGEQAFVALQSAAREHRRQEFENGG
ncbi:MAG TPA: YozE family protein [Trebonia sp.]